MTPYMGLTLPTVGVTLGPLWATELNAALTVIDAHNHTPGLGVQIPSTGLNINADLPFQNNNATGLRSTRFQNQNTPLAGIDDLTCLYASGGNLYYNNGSGAQVQITQGAGLDASTVGGFGGDYGTSTASAFYTSATSTFTFWQDANISALMDQGATTIHPSNSSVNGVTLNASTSMSSSYNLTFPVSLPGSTQALVVDASGNISANTAGITGITGSQIATHGILASNLPVANFFQSGSSTNFTQTATTGFTNVGASGTLTLDGTRPVMLIVASTNGGYVGISASTGSSVAQNIRILRNGTDTVYQTTIKNDFGSTSTYVPPSAITTIDFGFVSGSTNYTLQSAVTVTGTGSAHVQDCYLIAYEM